MGKAADMFFSNRSMHLNESEFGQFFQTINRQRETMWFCLLVYLSCVHFYLFWRDIFSS